MRAWLHRLGRLQDRVPGLPVLVQAVSNYIRHQSANQAGSVAFSAILAMFPLLLLLSAMAGFVGQPGTAAALAERVVGYAPPLVGDALRPVIDQVLRQRSQALLALGVLITIWTASSGTQAIRTALNRAYGVEKGLSFWGARVKVILFTAIGTLGTVLVFGSVVILPTVWAFLVERFGVTKQALWLHNGVRYGLAFVVVALMNTAFYGWLPDIRQRVRTVLPGALVGALLWLVAAAALSYTLRSAGKLALVYGGFTGLVATLVFLYASAATLIFGAEVNAVLRERGQQRHATSAAPPDARPAGG